MQRGLPWQWTDIKTEIDTFSNAVGRMVRTLTASALLTVASALPA